jgi:glutamate decarboxylase
LPILPDPLPPNEDSIEILRVVVRERMSFDLLDRLITDICQTTQNLILGFIPHFQFEDE